MNPIIDRMLGLTAEIAEELLLIKDAGRDNLSDNLKLRIISLAELAATVGSPVSPETSVPVDEIAGEPEGKAPADDDGVGDVDCGGEVGCRGDGEAGENDVKEEPETTDGTFVILEMEPDEEPSAEPPVKSVCEQVDVPAGAGVPVGRPVTETPRRRVEPADFYRSFSINDAFLYRREIFGGSKTRFDEALDHISVLPGRHALREYLVEHLKLNLDETPGKEFYQSLVVFF